MRPFSLSQAAFSLSHARPAWYWRTATHLAQSSSSSAQRGRASLRPRAWRGRRRRDCLLVTPPHGGRVRCRLSPRSGDHSGRSRAAWVRLTHRACIRSLLTDQRSPAISCPGVRRHGRSTGRAVGCGEPGMRYSQRIAADAATPQRRFRPLPCGRRHSLRVIVVFALRSWSLTRLGLVCIWGKWVARWGYTAP